jgi:hypothetical protein
MSSSLALVYLKPNIEIVDRKENETASSHNETTSPLHPIVSDNDSVNRSDEFTRKEDYASVIESRPAAATSSDIVEQVTIVEFKNVVNNPQQAIDTDCHRSNNKNVSSLGEKSAIPATRSIALMILCRCDCCSIEFITLENSFSIFNIEKID